MSAAQLQRLLPAPHCSFSPQVERLVRRRQQRVRAAGVCMVAPPIHRVGRAVICDLFWRLGNASHVVVQILAQLAGWNASFENGEVQTCVNAASGRTCKETFIALKESGLAVYAADFEKSLHSSLIFGSCGTDLRRGVISDVRGSVP